MKVIFTQDVKGKGK
ncbi:hypothetical protein, partial [Escherichia coli]